MDKKENSNNEWFKPTAEQEARRERVYKRLQDMIDRRNETYNEFNVRTLVQYIDAGDKRLNAYTPPKENYDPPKQEWQSNLTLPTIRDKMKRILAGFSLKVPDFEVKMYGEDDGMDIDRAHIAKWLITGSYTQEENSVLENFWEAWESAARGTVIKYEGYLKTKIKQKFIKSYDIVTGKIESDEREVTIDDKCISLIVPLNELYITDFYIQNIQDQPAIAWVRYYDHDTFEFEFGKYANAKYVKRGNQLTSQDSQTFYSKKHWEVRAGEEKIEVVRFYCSLTDEYIIFANGVELLNAPLLWTVNGRKMYPFAKTIWEPFANKDFFYGNSFPNLLAGQYDNYNTLWNTVTDKQFRSIVPPLLVGRVNVDSFNLEDEIILNGTTKITVEDVNQVREMPVQGVNNADIMMLQLIAKGIEDQAPSLPSTLQGRDATAREVVLTDEKIREFRVIYDEMITDLWKQKYHLRMANIELNYPQPRIVKDEENGKTKDFYRTYIIENAVLDRKTGETGILAIQFRKISDTDRRKVEEEIAIEEKMMKQQNMPYRKLIIPPDYFDSYKLQLEIIPTSVYRTNLARMQSLVSEKLEKLANMFPQVFIANQDELFSQLVKSYDDDPKKYLAKYNEIKQQMQMQGQQQAIPQEQAGMMDPNMQQMANSSLQ